MSNVLKKCILCMLRVWSSNCRWGDPADFRISGEESLQEVLDENWSFTDDSPSWLSPCVLLYRSNHLGKSSSLAALWPCSQNIFIIKIFWALLLSILFYFQFMPAYNIAFLRCSRACLSIIWCYLHARFLYIFKTYAQNNKIVVLIAELKSSCLGVYKE